MRASASERRPPRALGDRDHKLHRRVRGRERRDLDVDEARGVAGLARVVFGDVRVLALGAYDPESASRIEAFAEGGNAPEGSARRRRVEEDVDRRSGGRRRVRGAALGELALEGGVEAEVTNERDA